MVAWYFTPEPESGLNRQTALSNSKFAEKYEEDKRICADAVPFMGKTLSTDYARTISTGSYMGMNNTGLFCNSPMSIPTFFGAPMISEDYKCEASKLPFELSEWNPKWFSPICRPWFQH
mmetsp:Transcript_44007/g.58388  ORF Transcript_44007/g.58388 Transcript_44007/m.58388 type:complete len:119 (+) Transcript_44007:674-1030(+)